MSEAECKGQTDLFFPPLDDKFLQTDITPTNRSNEGREVGAPRRHARISKAKALCALCPVEHECLSWAMRLGSHYQEPICGGKTWFERKRWLRRFRDSIRARTSELQQSGYSWTEVDADMVRLVMTNPQPGVNDVRSGQLSLVG